MRTIEKLQAPTGLIDPIVSRGQFDHRYDAEGLIKIPSDGKLHRVITDAGLPLQLFVLKSDIVAFVQVEGWLT